MFRRSPGLLVALAMGLMLVSCDRDLEGADDLRKELARDDFRSSYARAPGWDRRRRLGTSPHGLWVDIYVNRTMSEAIASNIPLDTWPIGSRLVLEGWSGPEETERDFLVVMTKPTAINSWFWAEWDAEDTVVFAGDDVDHCVRCHRSGADLVRSFGLPPRVLP